MTSKHLAACTLALALAACGDDDEHPVATPDASTADARVPGNFYMFPCVPVATVTGKPTFTAVYLEVLCTSGCVQSYCHGYHGAWAGLDLTLLDGAYESLVNQPTGKFVPVDMRPTCAESSLLRVQPGAPDQSLLYLKLAGKQPCGTMMPPPDSGFPRISDEKLSQVRAWIEQGAKDFSMDSL